MNVFFGIADAHGIESFIPESHKNQILFALSIRAESNRQRHACLYKVGCTDDNVRVIKALIESGERDEALGYMKENCECQIQPGFENSWELIPNSKLDPYWSANGKM